ncbi:MAG: ceramidase domain-containing protein [Micromonosporaceae bacterium]
MDWTDQVDAYCERISPAFWAEPVNAFSNGSFLIAAVLIWWLLRRGPGRPPASLVALAVVMASIGVGSFLFHTYATLWAEQADVIPIRIFMLLFFACYLHWFWQARWWLAWLGAVGFIVFSLVIGPVAGDLLPNGSGMYLPAFLVLAGAAFALLLAPDPGRRRHWPWLAGATVIFAVSLAFRTVDNDACAGFALGTHWVWHLLNGLLLYVLSFAVVRRWHDLTATSPETADATV